MSWRKRLPDLSPGLNHARGYLADRAARAVALAGRVCKGAVEAAGRLAARAGPLAVRQTRVAHLGWRRLRRTGIRAAGALGAVAGDLLSAGRKRSIHGAEIAKRWAGAAKARIDMARTAAAQRASPVMAPLRQRWHGGRRWLQAAAGDVGGRTVERLRNSPLAPALARVERWRAARLSPGRGRYRVEVSIASSRRMALGAVLVLAVLAALPAFVERDLINDLIFVLTMLALAQYWNLLAGYAGLVSIGQQAFVGLGGYLLFALTVHAGIDPLLAILLAGFVAGLLAVPTALIVFRLRGAYFAIGTWVMAEVYRLVLAQFRQLGGGTGTSLPPHVTNEVAGIAWVKALLDVRTSVARDIVTYWAALILAAATILVVYLILRSRHGLALAAIRDSEAAAESVGVDSFRAKLQVYGITAVGTGMVGALIYLQKARISPDAAFSVLDWTAYVIFIVVIGGIGTIEGPIIGVIVFYLLQTNLAHFGTWYLILLGLLASIVMLFAPRGIWGYLAERRGLAVFRLRRQLAPVPHGEGSATLHAAGGPPGTTSAGQ